MWSYFSRDPIKNFAFEIGKKIEGLEEKSIWTVHEGKRKTNGEPVTVFCFDIKNSSESQVQIAKTSFKKIKTLRHPNILTFLDGIENEKVIYVVTESVTPLEVYLLDNADQQHSNELAISWGLHQTAKGLSFLINDCNFIHNNMCMSSVFVDKAGEWKLAGVDYMYPANGRESIPPVKILPALERYDPPERAGPGRKPTEPWSTDSWGLGCLIWEIFNGTLQRTTALKQLGKIPKSLVPRYCELVGANPKSRPNPANFVQNCRSSQGFMDNKFVDTMLFLEEIQIKDQTEKNNFFNSLPPVLDTFPQTFCKHRILPQLLYAFEYGNAGSAVLAPLFKVGKCLDSAEYQEKIVPCIVKLFSSTDRSTRVKLLQQVETFVEHLNPTIVNDKIFPNLLHGFNDTNPVVREHTIKGMMHLAPKLNYKNLNEELLKHFARLQSKDDQGGIRTNTTICLGKVAGYLNPEMRQKILASAYLRAMKDPFPPARQAAVIAMAATNNFFTLQESAARLVPALCSMVMDPEKVVRDQAFKAIRCFLSKLEKASENPEMTEELEKDVKAGGTGASAAGWTGWAVGGVSSITSKFYRTGPGKSQSPPAKVTSTASAAVEGNSAINNKATSNHETTNPPSTLQENHQEKQQPEMVTPPQRESEEKVGDNAEYADYNDEWGDDGGWEDDGNWGNMDDAEEEEPDSTTDTKTKMEPAMVTDSVGESDGWEDEGGDWGSLEEPTSTTTQSSRKPTQESSASTSNTTAGALKLGGLNKKDRSPSPWGGSQNEFTKVDDSDFVSTSNYNWGTQSQQSEDEFFNSLIQDEKKSTKKTLQSASSKKPATSPAQKQTSTKSTSSSSIQSSASKKQPVSSTTKQSQNISSFDDFSSWGDDSWEGAGGKVSSSSSAGGGKKSSASSATTDTGDEGWGVDDWGSTDNQGMSQAEIMKKKREEKKLERQKEMNEKRAARQTGSSAMKLGTKKLAKD